MTYSDLSPVKILTGATYSNNRSDLAMTILKVHYQEDDKAKVRGILFEKRHGYVQETKNYTLRKELIWDWEIIPSKP